MKSIKKKKKLRNKFKNYPFNRKVVAIWSSISVSCCRMASLTLVEPGCRSKSRSINTPPIDVRIPPTCSRCRHELQTRLPARKNLNCLIHKQDVHCLLWMQTGHLPFTSFVSEYRVQRRQVTSRSAHKESHRTLLEIDQN